MSVWVYVAWFRSLLLNPDEQDSEWVATFRITAESAERAKVWGDYLAKKRALGHGEDQFLRSEIHPPTDSLYQTRNLAELPLVQDGVESADAVIGW